MYECTNAGGCWVLVLRITAIGHTKVVERIPDLAQETSFPMQLLVAVVAVKALCSSSSSSSLSCTRRLSALRSTPPAASSVGR